MGAAQGATGAAARGWTEGLARWVSVSVALAGAVFAGGQFLEAKTIWRLERTTPYFERYESGEIGKARRQLAASLKAYRDQFDEIERAGVTPADRDAMMTGIFTADPTVGDSFDMIADFFQGLRVCVEAELCDRGVTTRYFASSDARDLWTLAGAYVRYRRDNNPTYAAAFESFLGEGAASAPAPAAKPSPAPVLAAPPEAPAAAAPATAEGVRPSGRPGIAVPAGAPPAEAGLKPDSKAD